MHLQRFGCPIQQLDERLFLNYEQERIQCETDSLKHPQAAGIYFLRRMKIGWMAETVIIPVPRNQLQETEYPLTVFIKILLIGECIKALLIA